jgi:hypothetical protein
MNPLATFGNPFGVDTLMIFFIILLLFGARKLGQLSRELGEAMRKPSDDREKREEDDQPGIPLPTTLLALLSLAAITTLSGLGVLTRGEVLALIVMTLLVWVVAKLGSRP